MYTILVCVSLVISFMVFVMLFCKFKNHYYYYYYHHKLLLLKHFISLGAGNTNIPLAILVNYWRRRISVCLQSGVANAINTRSNRLAAKTLDAGGLHSSHDREAFFPGLIEDQSEALQDGVPIGREFDGG